MKYQTEDHLGVCITYFLYSMMKRIKKEEIHERNLLLDIVWVIRWAWINESLKGQKKKLLFTTQQHQKWREKKIEKKLTIRDK